MNFSETFIRRPIATSLLMAALALVGIVAFPLLPVAPLPQVDFPTIQVYGDAGRRQPRNHGRHGGDSARAAVRADRRRYPDEFGQFARLDRHHAAIRSQPQHRRRRRDVQAAITAAGPYLPKNLTNPPTYKKVNPADSPILIVAATSNTMPLTKVDDFAENVVAQQISQICRRRAGQYRRPAAAGHSRPGRSRQADGARSDAGGRARRLDRLNQRRRQRHDDRQAADLHDLRQRPIDHGGTLQRRDHCLSQRRTGSGARRRPRDLRAARRDSGRAASRAERGDAASLQAAGRQRDRHRRQHQGGAGGPACAHSAGHPSANRRRPHADYSRRGEGRRIHAAVVVRAGRAGDPAVPAQHSSHAHSRRGRAVVAARRHRHYLSGRLQPGQLVADGTDHRRRLRRRRCHRRGREHLPSSGSGHHAAAIGDQGRA